MTPYLTINAGFRYEMHPPLKDTHYNTAAFLPDYDENGIHGGVAVPNAQGLTYTNPGFAVSIAPTPILTAAQAGLPVKLRYTDKSDYGPRIGFAWRPNQNNSTVIRGGWGRFIESPLGFSLVSGWAVSASFVPLYSEYVQPGRWQRAEPQLPFSFSGEPGPAGDGELRICLSHPLQGSFGTAVEPDLRA